MAVGIILVIIIVIIVYGISLFLTGGSIQSGGNKYTIKHCGKIGTLVMGIIAICLIMFILKMVNK